MAFFCSISMLIVGGFRCVVHFRCILCVVSPIDIYAAQYIDHKIHYILFCTIISMMDHIRQERTQWNG